MKLFNKILIANRGEIAVRIIKSAKALGIPVAAVYAKADMDSLHIQMADEIYCLGESALEDTYLNIDKIVQTAVDASCDAIHPGYGFLAENAEFAAKCQDAGITFIGPSVETIESMGNKVKARELMKSLNVPLIEGVTGSTEEILPQVEAIGYPVLIKAAGGGGGKGMRIVYDSKNLKQALEDTSREAKAYFNDDSVFVEKYIQNPRHIEYQILGDNHHSLIHLFERECSIQRRYQKIIEEAPSPTLTPEVRASMADLAVHIGKSINYTSAGTIEFLVDENLNYYFLEMNTRIQVEHPVTELTTGVDLIKEQILIAAGNPMTYKQSDIKQNGHAIESRIYAEHPAKNFMPSPGKMTLYSEPELNDIRLDTGIAAQTEIKSFYDPMICKLISYGSTRNEAIRKMLLALGDYKIHGIRTNIQYLKKLIDHQYFRQNKISTNFCDEHTEDFVKEILDEKTKISSHKAIAAFLLKEIIPSNSQNVWKRIGYWRSMMHIPLQVDDEAIFVKIKHVHAKRISFILDGINYHAEIHRISDHKIEFTLNKHYLKVYFSDQEDGKCDVEVNTHIWKILRKDSINNSLSHDFEENYVGDQQDAVFAPMHGKITKLSVAPNEEVAKGQTLMIIEAMKMENNIIAPRNGIIEKIHVEESQQIESGKLMLSYKIVD